jgi:hypothetical protein
VLQFLFQLCLSKSPICANVKLSVVTKSICHDARAIELIISKQRNQINMAAGHILAPLIRLPWIGLTLMSDLNKIKVELDFERGSEITFSGPRRSVDTRTQSASCCWQWPQRWVVAERGQQNTNWIIFVYNNVWRILQQRMAHAPLHLYAQQVHRSRPSLQYRRPLGGWIWFCLIKWHNPWYQSYPGLVSAQKTRGNTVTQITKILQMLLFFFLL